MDEQQEVQEELSKVNINGQEYDPTEAQELIGLGQKARDAEKQYNITIDSIMPAYTKANMRAKDADRFESELSEAKRKLEAYESKQEAGTDTQADLVKAREAARKLGIVLDEDVKGKYLSKEEMESFLNERDSQREAVNKILDEANGLESEIDGKDGRPRFNKKAVLAYAKTYGSNSLKEAYEDMHADALKDWQDQRIAEKKQPGLKTLASQQGNKQPSQVKVTDDNSVDLLREALYGKK